MSSRNFAFILSLALFLLAGVNSYAALTASGTWAHQEVTANKNLVLTDRIYLDGPIIIKSGVTLTLTRSANYTADKILRITPSANFKFESDHPRCLFLVEQGAKLIIKGSDVETACIGIKGNYSYVMPTAVSNHTKKVGTADYTTEINNLKTAVSNGSVLNYGNGGLIYAIGSVQLQHVRLYDMYSSTGDGDAPAGAIYRPAQNSNKYEYGSISIDHCRIVQNYTQSGGAITVFNQRVSGSDNPANTRDNCKITVSNTTIAYNTSTHKTTGGAIRTGGGVIGDIILQNVQLYDNYAFGEGGAIYWNAHGRSDYPPRLIMDGCTICHNHANWNGGALLLEGAFLFQNNVTKIYSNVADSDQTERTADTEEYGDGGAMSITTYGSSGIEGIGVQTLSMMINNYASIYSNSAYNGGAIAITTEPSSDLTEGSTLDISLNGASIKTNKARKYGGGVYVYCDNASLNTKFTVSSGTIQSNEAQSDGGGFYFGRGDSMDPTKVTIKFNGGTVSSNEAVSGGGGGIRVDALKIQCDENASGVTLSSNTAGTYGGGLHLQTKAEFVMNSGKVSGNNAPRGAGIAVMGGSDMELNKGEVSGNNAGNNGGGIYVINSGSHITVNDGKIINNGSETATFNAVGVHVSTGASMEMYGGEISGNKTTGTGGGVYVNGTFYMEGGKISGNKSAGGAGIHIQGSGASVRLATKDLSDIATVTSNTSSSSGGGIQVNAGAVLTIDGGEISSNTASVYGGGVYVENAQCTINGGEIKDNTNTSDAGGGVAVIKGGICNITDGTISGNTADKKNGGGIYVWNSTLNFSGGKVFNNEAKRSGGGTGFGGGLYITSTDGNTSVATFNGGEFYENKAYSGAGLFCANSSLIVNDGMIRNNTSTGGHGGGMFVESGSLEFRSGKLYGNKCTVNGGALALDAGATAVISGGQIYDNATDNNGGGICVSASSLTFEKGAGEDEGCGIYNNTSSINAGGLYMESTSTVNMSGGSIYDNSALIGGAICNKGGTLTFTGGNITGNVARCGGGVFLSGTGSVMKFGDGLIRNNKAEDKSGHSLATGYGYNVSGSALDLQGTGGGIYIQDGASLSFTGENVGIYANEAETMADDIYSNGSNGAQITLPNVSSMNLSGYNSRTSELYWVEDYMTGDTGYSNGPAIAGTSHSAVRYRDAIAAQSTVYPLQADKLSSYTGKYLALSIGHEVIYVTLQRTGLQAGESAIYRIFRIDNGVPSVYSEVLLTGSAGAPLQSKRVALYSGKWRVEETLWTWTYVPPAAIERDITGSTDAQNKVFSFAAAKKDSMPEHAEDVVVNDFGEGAAVTGSYINSGSINDLQNTTDYQLK